MGNMFVVKKNNIDNGWDFISRPFTKITNLSHICPNKCIYMFNGMKVSKNIRYYLS